MGLLEVGIPLSLLADSSSGSGPGWAGIYRAELVRVVDSLSDSATARPSRQLRVRGPHRDAR